MIVHFITSLIKLVLGLVKFHDEMKMHYRLVICSKSA